MKKPLLLGVSTLALLAVSATLFAQTTTGASVIAEMKAAIRPFTLAGDLNPGITGLQSSPVEGKKTGDMLTAGEYNRILELVGQGGGGGSSCDTIVPGWPDALYCTGSLGSSILRLDEMNVGGGWKYKNDDAGNVTYIRFNQNKTFESQSGDTRWNSDCANKTISQLQTEKKAFGVCGNGGGGGTGTGGGGSGWVDVPLTDTANFDATCEYRYTSGIGNVTTGGSWCAGWRYVDQVSIDRLHNTLDRYVTEVFPDNKSFARTHVSQVTAEYPAGSCTLTQMQKRC